MNVPVPWRGPASSALLPILLCLPLATCGILDEDAPDTARLVIEGPAGHPLRLVTTSDFDVVASPGGDSPEVSVISADTAAVTAPFDRSYSLGPRTRIYVIVGSDSTAASPVRVRTFIDGEIRFDRSSRFVDGAELEFVFAAAGS